MADDFFADLLPMKSRINGSKDEASKNVSKSPFDKNRNLIDDVNDTDGSSTPEVSLLPLAGRDI